MCRFLPTSLHPHSPYNVRIAAIPVGIFFILTVYITRIRFKQRKRLLAGIVACILFTASVASVFNGAWYIEDTWNEDYSKGAYVYGPINFTALITCLWFFLVLFVHGIAVYVTRKQQKDGNVPFRYTSQVFQQTPPGFRTFNVDRNDAKSKDAGAEHLPTIQEAPKATTDLETYDDNPQETFEDTQDPEFRGESSGFVMPDLKTGTVRTFFDDNTVVPSYWFLFRVKMYEMYGCCCECSCCCKDIKADNNLNDTRMGTSYELKKTNPLWRFLDGLKLFLWYCISGLFLYMTIVNIGATQQQTVVRQHLHPAFEYLYPANYQIGPMWYVNKKDLV